MLGVTCFIGNSRHAVMKSKRNFLFHTVPVFIAAHYGVLVLRLLLVIYILLIIMMAFGISSCNGQSPENKDIDKMKEMNTQVYDLVEHFDSNL